MTALVVAMASLVLMQGGEDLPTMLGRHKLLKAAGERHASMLEILTKHGKQMDWGELTQDLSDMQSYFEQYHDYARLERILTLHYDRSRTLEDGKYAAGNDLVYLPKLARCQLKIGAHTRYEKSVDALLRHKEASLLEKDVVDEYLRFLYANNRAAHGDKTLASLIEVETKQALETPASAYLQPENFWKYRFTQATIGVIRGKTAEAKAVLTAYRAYEIQAKASVAEELKKLSKEERDLHQLLMADAARDENVNQELKLLVQLLDLAEGKVGSAVAKAESSFLNLWRMTPQERDYGGFITARFTLLRDSNDVLISSLTNRLDRLDATNTNRLAGLLLTRKGAASHFALTARKLSPNAGPIDESADVESPLYEDYETIEKLTPAARARMLFLIRKHICSELVAGTDNPERLHRLLMQEIMFEPHQAEEEGIEAELANLRNLKPAIALQSCQAVQAKLSPTALYVDFQKRKPTPFVEKNAAVDHYLAIVLQQDKPVTIIDLGPAAIIEADVATLQQLLYEASKTIAKIGEPGAEKLFREPAQRLAAKLFGPFADLLTKDRELLISPDSQLWNVPWAALVKANGAYLVEEHPITTVLGPQGLMTAKAEKPVQTALILANPDYGDGTAPRANVADGIVSRGNRSRVRLGQIPQLAHADTEGESVQTVLKDQMKLKVEYVTGRDATVTKALNGGGGGAGILHFVTHGYSLGAPADKTTPASKLYADNPTLAFAGTGLLMADCNRPRSDKGLQEGLLTGLQILNMDLKLTQLVVLSACETGLGQPTEGEGVMGLAKAFHLAGARHVVSTLWQVPDLASAVLVAEFYNRLDLNRVAHSLQLAQVQMILERRKRFGAAHPFFWAAYTLTK